MRTFVEHAANVELIGYVDQTGHLFCASCADGRDDLGRYSVSHGDPDCFCDHCHGHCADVPTIIEGTAAVEYVTAKIF